MSWLGRIFGAAQGKAPAPELREFGVTGTPIFGGFLRDAGEYNPSLEGLSAFSTYEKMRRSDAQVAATLMGMKLPIRSAEWTVQEPEDASQVEKEATEFIRQELLENLDLDAVIENALLMLDFGCAAHEDVWYVDQNRVRLKKLAPRLPVTFYRWLVEGDELKAIEQYAWDGAHEPMPADKLALFTFGQEGANFAGRSVLRSMYQHWYIKSNLYKIDAIACERNGMGVPWAEMGESAKVEDRRLAHEWLQSLAAHERASILLPPGWKWGLRGVEGTVRDPKESIAHHNMQISMAGLAQFMMLGQSESGNRALGQTMSDFFYLSLEATAGKIARVMNWSTIPRLCDFNFSGLKKYPALMPQRILSLDFTALVEALSKLAQSSAITVDEDLEKWLRSKLGAPEKAAPKPSMRARLSELQLRRAPRGPEKFLALAEIAGELDRGRDRIAAALRRAKSAVQAEIVNKVVNAPVRSMHRVSIAPPEKLTAEIETILEELFEFGRVQVEGERARQRKGLEPSDAAAVRAADLRRKRNPLGIYADGVVSEFVNVLAGRAINVALDWLRRPGDLSKGEIIRRVEEELDEQSDKWIDGAAAKGANEAFADGRADGYEEHKDEIREVYYSALLDFNTCGNCSAADGQTGRTPDEITAVPNPDCDGGDKCRCVHVFVFEGEA